MQKFNKPKQILLLIGIMLASVCVASNLSSLDGGSAIIIKKSGVQETPRNVSVQASINDHTLALIINENIGQVTIEVTSSTGFTIFSTTTTTPDSESIFISTSGDYEFTITLSNGDEYYGEFTITD